MVDQPNFDSELPPEANNAAIAEQQVTKTPSRRPRTLPITQEQFEQEIKQDRLREFQISLYQIMIVLFLVMLAVLYMRLT